MIYIDTRRAFWVKELTIPKFFGTTFVLGTSGFAAVLCWADFFGAAELSNSARITSGVAIIFQLALAAWETRIFRGALADANAREPSFCVDHVEAEALPA